MVFLEKMTPVHKESKYSMTLSRLTSWPNAWAEVDLAKPKAFRGTKYDTGSEI
jgi:hypothetical protein